jgi:hypothetical protein
MTKVFRCKTCKRLFSCAESCYFGKHYIECKCDPCTNHDVITNTSRCKTRYLSDKEAVAYTL